MFKSTKLGPRISPQYWALGTLSATALSVTLILMAFGRPVFGRFIGGINPLVALSTVLLVMAAVTPLASRIGAFQICGAKTAKGLRISVCLAALFGLIIIIADVAIVFPPGLNVPLPEALLFYPVIGYSLEVLLHVLPVLAISLAIASRPHQKLPIWLGLVATAGIEPSLQVYAGFADGYPKWVAGFVFVYIYAINLCQLVILRRYDFISMLALRLGYYVAWHIGWGYFRLHLLF